MFVLKCVLRLEAARLQGLPQVVVEVLYCLLRLGLPQAVEGLYYPLLLEEVEEVL